MSFWEPDSRETGGSAPNNLITLCEHCHNQYHQGKIQLPVKIKHGMSFTDAALMRIVRWALYNKLRELYPDVSMTYGYITKNTRIRHNLPKTHFADGRCISGHPDAKPPGYSFCQRKVCCHNRQLYKAKTLKGNKRRLNQAPYQEKGFRLFDKVLYAGKEYFIFARRQSGYFDIRTLDGEKVSNGSISYKKLKLIEPRKYYLTERRDAETHSPEGSGFPHQKIYGRCN